MGYDVHITRRENWHDEGSESDISLEEWVSYVSNDPEMRLDGYAEVELPEGDVFRVEQEGISVWEKYSQEGIGQNHAWFTYHKGNVSVKNPDQEIINKMVEIANRLDAKVQGDGGEFYGKLTKIPWWRFW